MSAYISFFYQHISTSLRKVTKFLILSLLFYVTEYFMHRHKLNKKKNWASVRLAGQPHILPLCSNSRSLEISKKCQHKSKKLKKLKLVFCGRIFFLAFFLFFSFPTYLLSNQRKNGKKVKKNYIFTLMTITQLKEQNLFLWLFCKTWIDHSQKTVR